MLPVISIKIFLAKGEIDHNKMNTQCKLFFNGAVNCFLFRRKVIIMYSGRHYRS